MPNAFEYRPYESQNLASLARLIGEPQRVQAQGLREAAQIRARELEMRGQGRASLASSIGSTLQTLGQMPMQIRAQQQHDQENALRMRGLNAQVTRDERDLQAQDAQAQSAARLQSIFAKNPNPPPEEIYAEIGPEAGNALLKGIAATRELENKNAANRRELVATSFGGLLAFPTPEMQSQEYKELRAHHIANGDITPQEFPEQYDPSVVKSAILRAMSPEKQFDAINPAAVNVAGVGLVQPPSRGGAATDAKVIVPASTKAADETARHNREMERIQGLTAGRLEAQSSETARHNRAMEGLADRRSGSLFSDDVPDDIETAASRATLSLPATRRAPIVQTINRLVKEGKLADAKEVIMQAAVEGENVDQKNLIMGRRAILATLADTRAILDELKKKGVPTNWLAGNAEDLARRLGKTTNPEYVKLGNSLMDALITYRRSATGAAFGEREGKDYAGMFANYRNDLPVNQALIDGLERSMKTYDRTYWENKLGKGGAELVGATPTPKDATSKAAPTEGQAGSVNGVPAIWKTNGPQGAGWYAR